MNKQDLINSEDKKLLRIRDLHVHYTSDGQVFHAVNGIDIDIDKGKTFGLVGETGAGKTTTALSIMQLLPERSAKLTSKGIFLGDEDLTKLSDAKLGTIRGELVSMIFQDPMSSLNPVLPVGKQIGEAIKLHNPGLSKDQINKRVGDLLKLVGIPTNRGKEYPHQFSGGMKQRVVISIALACNPLLLIADEPTTALDVTIQAQVLRLMKGLKEEFNTAMLLITHDLGIVAEMCDDVAVMYAGEIVEQGTVEDIFESEARHPYTEGLFGSIPKLDDDESTRLSPIYGLMPDPAALPEGCKFHPRCEKCMEICKTKEPELYESGTHKIRCHLFKDMEVDHE